MLNIVSLYHHTYILRPAAVWWKAISYQCGGVLTLFRHVLHPPLPTIGEDRAHHDQPHHLWWVLHYYHLHHLLLSTVEHQHHPGRGEGGSHITLVPVRLCL